MLGRIRASFEVISFVLRDLSTKRALSQTKTRPTRREPQRAIPAPSQEHARASRLLQAHRRADYQPCCIRSGVLTAKTRIDLDAMTTKPKKPKAPRRDFADARKACRTPAERERLALVIAAGWTSDGLAEYARLFFFRNGKDYPTPTSYRRAIEDIANASAWREPDEKLSYDDAFGWLNLFREGKSKPLPPRRAGLLQRGRGESDGITPLEYAWPGHTEQFRSMIEARCRDYFKIAPESRVHVNAWAASQRAYWRERYAETGLGRYSEGKAPRKPKTPKPRPALSCPAVTE